MKKFNSPEELQTHFDQLHETENDSSAVSCTQLDRLANIIFILIMMMMTMTMTMIIMMIVIIIIDDDVSSETCFVFIDK